MSMGRVLPYIVIGHESDAAAGFRRLLLHGLEHLNDRLNLFVMQLDGLGQAA